MRIFILAFFLPLLPSLGVSVLEDHKNSLWQHLHFTQFTPNSRTKIRVAILDNGFLGLESSARLEKLQSNRGKLTYIPPKFPEYAPVPSPHGLIQAEAFVDLLDRDEHLELYLINSQGILNFRNALKEVINLQVDVVLYAQNWTFWDNWNGSGAINSMINQTLQSLPQLFWFNSVANSKSRVKKSNVNFSYENHRHAIKNTIDQNNLSVELIWNDPSWDVSATFVNLNYQDENVRYGLENLDQFQASATTELKLILKDESGKILAESDAKNLLARKKLRFPNPLTKDKKYIAGLPRGIYYLEVLNLTPHLFQSQDNYRIIITGQDFEFLGASSFDELLIPDNNPNLIRIGDCDVNQSASGADVYYPSRIIFTNKKVEAGSSSATTIAAAKFVRELMINSTITDRTTAITSLTYYERPSNNACDRIKRIPNNKLVQ